MIMINYRPRSSKNKKINPAFGKYQAREQPPNLKPQNINFPTKISTIKHIIVEQPRYQSQRLTNICLKKTFFKADNHIKINIMEGTTIYKILITGSLQVSQS